MPSRSARSALAALAACASLVATGILPARAVDPPPAPSSPPQPLEPFPEDQLRPGLKAQVRTALQGSTPELIDAEIIGVLDDGIAPGIDMILGKLTGERGVFTGVAAGMSGSPVIVDGKVVGALSYAIGQFSKEAVFGVTPIRQMLALSQYPGGLLPWSGRPAAGGFAAAPLALAAPGVSASTLESLDDLWTQLGLARATGAAASASPGPGRAEIRSAMQPGDPVSALLVWGDLKLGATGTITWRDGDRIYAFGHPFMSSGRATMPLAPSEVLYTVASSLNAFKIARIGDPVGTVEQDRLTAIAGTLGPVPAGLPMRVTLRREGRPEVTKNYQLARDPFLTPLLGAVMLRMTVQDGLGAERDESLRMRGAVTLADGQTLRFGAGTAPGGLSGPPDQQLGFEVLAKIDELVRPPVPLPEVAALDIVVEAKEPAEAWRVRRALPDRMVARAGDTVRVHVDLASSRGAERREALDVTIPAATRPGTYTLLAGSSRSLAGEFGSVDEARRRTARTPQDYLAAIGDEPADDALEVTLARASEGLVSQGTSYPALPGTAHLLMRSRPGGTELYRSRYARQASTVRALDRTVLDVARVTIEILPRESDR